MTDDYEADHDTVLRRAIAEGVPVPDTMKIAIKVGGAAERLAELLTAIEPAPLEHVQAAEASLLARVADLRLLVTCDRELRVRAE